jgi:hypothetical protein
LEAETRFLGLWSRGDRYFILALAIAFWVQKPGFLNKSRYCGKNWRQKPGFLVCGQGAIAILFWRLRSQGIASLTDDIAVAKTIRTQELKHDPSRYAKNQIG